MISRRPSSHLCPGQRPFLSHACAGVCGSRLPFQSPLVGQIVGHGSKPRVDRFAFERENAEDALVDAVERFAGDKSFECLDAERELA